MRPLAIDLFCGLGGWTEGLLAESYHVVGFDIERHAYGEHRYPAQLVIQDVLTIHGSQFKDAALIVASPPCQEYSYMAMPWSRAKQIEADYKSGVRDVKQLTALFDACFRIQREASDAAGHHIPLVVENVRGAQKWVGKSRWNFGSFHLWGDVPALMPMVRVKAKRPGHSMNKGAPQWGPHHNTDDIVGDGVKVPTMGAGWYPPEHPKHVAGLAFNGHAEKAIKNNGGSWFNIGSPGQKETGRNPVHELAKGRRTDKGNGVRFTSRDCGVEGVKHGSAYRGDCYGWGVAQYTGSKSKARKAASAMIAKIPLVLSRHIAASWKPEHSEARTA